MRIRCIFRFSLSYGGRFFSYVFRLEVYSVLPYPILLIKRIMFMKSTLFRTLGQARRDPRNSTVPDLSTNTLLQHSIAHHFGKKRSAFQNEMSEMAPEFKKLWASCLNNNTAIASCSWRKCEPGSNACLHTTHSRLPTSPSLTSSPSKRQRPVDRPVFIRGWFLLNLSNFSF